MSGLGAWDGLYRVNQRHASQIGCRAPFADVLRLSEHMQLKGYRHSPARRGLLTWRRAWIHINTRSVAETRLLVICLVAKPCAERAQAGSDLGELSNAE